jgi:hypothetical protein
VNIRYRLIANTWHAYTILHRQKAFNLSKQTFCNTGLKYQTLRTVSNGHHFLHIYSFCVENKKFMVVFSILIQYFRPPQEIFVLSNFVYCEFPSSSFFVKLIFKTFALENAQQKKDPN